MTDCLSDLLWNDNIQHCAIQGIDMFPLKVESLLPRHSAESGRDPRRF